MEITTGIADAVVFVDAAALRLDDDTTVSCEMVGIGAVVTTGVGGGAGFVSAGLAADI